MKTFNDRGYPSMGEYYLGDLTPGLENWSQWTIKNGSVYPELSPNSEKQYNLDQSAISDLVKGTGKKGVSNQDADTLLDWAKEYNFPHRDDRGKDHWVGGEHIHIGPKHVPVQK